MTKIRTLLIPILLAHILTSCWNKVEKVKDFSNNDLLWYRPYNKTDTVVFISEKSELDTIVFFKKIATSDSTRSFEQGISNTNYLTVPYDFTKGSYHQFAIMGDGKTRYSQDILNMSKSSSGHGSLEIIFIGTIFRNKIKNIQKTNDSIYFFDSKKADYSGMNVEKGIKDFTFNTEIGITNYTDDRNVKWKRE
jgi:hypothetical protein